MRRTLPTSALFLLVASLLAGTLHAPSAGAAATSVNIDPAADKILHNLSTYYAGLKSFRVDLSTTMHLEAQGMKQQVETRYKITMNRPNKIAVIHLSGMMGATIVCDGKQLYIYIPMMKKYTVEKAPADFDALFDREEMGMLMGLVSFTPSLLRKNPYDDILEGIRSVKYGGLGNVGLTRCHRIIFTQDEFDWEMWVRAEGNPLVEKLRIDMSKSLKGEGSPFGDTKNVKMEIVMTYTNWETNIVLLPDSFKFTPPKGARKVDSFFEGMGEEEPNPLLGKEAPDFTLELLDGGKMNLKSHKGKNVVILDFWATWCGPCRKALPTVAEVASEYKAKGVVFYAVNLREKPETIRDFLKKQKIKCAVILDKDGSVAELYGVEGIPQTVFIGKDGTVQSVHVGYMPGLKEKYKSEVEALLTGKNLAAEELKKRKKKQAAEVKIEGMKKLWQLDGPWAAFACDPAKNAIYAISSRGTGAQVDPSGKKVRDFKISDRVSVARAANLAGDKAKELVTFAAWGPTVKAHDPATGKLLWTHRGGQGIDDVWTADLNGDGMDEVIIGYNGATGLYVLDNRGNTVWKYSGPRFGNVWHVCAGDINGDGALEIVTTSARGDVHIFNANGKMIKTLAPGCYANMIRTAKVKGTNFAVAGSNGETEVTLVALDFGSNKKWSLTLPSWRGAYIDSAQVAASKPWIAVGLRSGSIFVVDVVQGKVVAKVGGQGTRPQVGWFERRGGGSPILLVATGGALNAFEIAAK